MSRGAKAKKIDRVEFQNMELKYPTQTRGLGPFSFELRPGTVYWVRGESGSGKSTFLKGVAGIVAPSGGNYLINDERVDQMSFEEFLPYRLNIGYGFATGGLLNNRTLRENLSLPLVYHDRLDLEEGNDFASAIMTEMGISDFADTRPALAPDGVLKIASIIRAFIMGPQVILLDDPTGGLDGARIDKVSRWMSYYRLKNRHSIFLVATDNETILQGFPTAEICIADNDVWVVESEDLDGVG